MRLRSQDVEKLRRAVRMIDQVESRLPTGINLDIGRADGGPLVTTTLAKVAAAVEEFARRCERLVDANNAARDALREGDR